MGVNLPVHDNLLREHSADEGSQRLELRAAQGRSALEQGVVEVELYVGFGNEVLAVLITLAASASL